MLHPVRWAAHRGLASYEFLVSREPWTDLWTRQLRRCADLRVYPASAWSAVAAAAYEGRMVLGLVRRRGQLAGSGPSR